MHVCCLYEKIAQVMVTFTGQLDIIKCLNLKFLMVSVYGYSLRPWMLFTGHGWAEEEAKYVTAELVAGGGGGQGPARLCAASAEWHCQCIQLAFPSMQEWHCQASAQWRSQCWQLAFSNRQECQCLVTMLGKCWSSTKLPGQCGLCHRYTCPWQDIVCSKRGDVVRPP